MRRIVATVAMGLAALAALVAQAAPAAAHGVGGAEPTNFHTVVTGGRPFPGVVVRSVEGGSRLELANRARDEVVVVGYNDEPYLRVGPDGVFENEQSPATYLNRDRSGRTAPPDGIDPSAPPRWRKVSDEPVTRFHDHRAHWMAEQLPGPVQADPGRRHMVYGPGGIAPEWEVPVRLGQQEAVVTGRLEWRPGPSPLPWVVFAVAAGLALVTAGFARPLEAGMVSMAGALALLVVADVVHGVAIAMSYGDGPLEVAGRLLAGSFYAVVGWVVGLAAVVLLARRRVDGLYAAVFSSLSVALFGGFLDLAVLSRSNAPFALPLQMARLFVALSLAGLGLAVACVVMARRAPKPDEPEADEVDQAGGLAGGDEELSPAAGPARPDGGTPR